MQSPEKPVSTPVNNEEFVDLWNQIEDDYEEEINDARHRYDDRMTQLRKSWEDSNPDSEDKMSVTRRGIASLVRDIASSMDEEFTVEDVRHRLQQDNPFRYNEAHPSSISGVLSRMTREGMIRVTQKGGGPVPNRYISQ